MGAVGNASGELIAGKYRVDRVLGAGGMGTVFAATHVVLGQRVAIKRMHPERVGRHNAGPRFFREARAAARLRSQHAARVIDVGVLEDGAPFIVMEHLDGEDLAALIARRGALPAAEAVEYVLQAAEAIAEAHAAGIVHRDLKPENLFLTRDPAGSPCIKVLDFGISKLLGDELALTRAAVAVGTPLYMSPEQMVSSRDVDSRTDLWSLGVVLYELVTATRPFEADLPSELYARILHGAPRPISTIVAAVPAGLEAVILQCLQKERARRFANAADLAAALAPFLPERGAALAARVASVLGMATAPVRPTELLDADPPRSPAASPSVSPLAPSRARASTSAPGPRRAWLPIAAGIAALVVAASIIASVVRGRPAPIDAATSPSASSPRLPAASAPPPRGSAGDPAAPGSDARK